MNIIYIYIYEYNIYIYMHICFICFIQSYSWDDPNAQNLEVESTQVWMFIAVVYGSAWFLIFKFVYVWMIMDVYGCLWMFMDVYGCLWMFMDVYDCLWMFVDVCGCLWMFMGMKGHFYSVTTNSNLRNPSKRTDDLQGKSGCWQVVQSQTLELGWLVGCLEYQLCQQQYDDNSISH